MNTEFLGVGREMSQCSLQTNHSNRNEMEGIVKKPMQHDFEVPPFLAGIPGQNVWMPHIRIA